VCRGCGSFAIAKTELTHLERVDRALRDAMWIARVQLAWHHFGLDTPEAHAKATLDFHRAYRNRHRQGDERFSVSKPKGKWYELKVETNPFRSN